MKIKHYLILLFMFLSGGALAENPCETHGYDSLECVRYLAEQGYADVQFNLGLMYYKGEGVKQDDREAVRWWRKSAEQGDAAAQYNLGVMYDNGRGIKQDDREAVRWYRKSAEQGHAKAQYNLGVMYDNGRGIKQDDREAVRWYRKSAEQGDAVAQYNLGVAYNKGEGVKQDDREAVRWYRKSAEQGDAVAQYNLGVAYNKGEGVKQDDRETVRWWRKSAEQGHAKAQYNLGVMYWKGEGVIEDEREAYIWYSIAKANGIKEAAESIRTNKWHEYLTASEIKSAKQEAKRRLEKIENRTEQNNQQPASIGKVPVAKPPQNSNVAEKVFENAWRSIVVINNDEGQGSGIIVRPNIVATNCHVIDGDGDNVIVYKHDNRQASTNTPYEATIRYRDDDYDFCLLDVPSLWGIPATMRKYNTLNIGENVYALGSPKGLDLSLSTGIISQLRRGETNRYIQTDAAISPGSSGGGLFDSEGNLIGILTKKLVDEEVEGIGFAIPADLALDLP